MKTAIYFIITCFISVGAMLGAKVEKGLYFDPLILVAIGVWVLFIWGYNRRSKKAAQRRFKEQMFEHHMRVVRNNKG